MKTNSEKGLKIGQIMEINVSSTTTATVLARVEGFVTDSVRFSIVTPNPELILMAQKDKKLKNALNSANLSIPDGFGLKFAIPSLKIVKGRELFLDLIKLAAEKSWRVFLLGGLNDEAKIAVQKLENRYRNLKIESSRGPMLDNNAKPMTKVDEKLEKDSVEQINKFSPQLLFVAFGNPKQEIWVNEHLPKLNIGGAMSVGGTFRYIAGTSKLPPKWMASLGFEWLWRGLTEPKRTGRIFKAVFVFPVKCFLYKLKG